MPLEASQLTYDEIKSLIMTNWGYEISEIKRLPLGSANCCYVSGGDFRGFFKEFQSGFDMSAISREAELVEYLSLRGIPTVPFCRTHSGDAAICHRGHIISLSRYIDGETVDYTKTLPEKYRQPQISDEVARMLGRIHKALSGYKLPCEMGGDWLRRYSPESLAAQYDELLQKNERQRSHKDLMRSERIAADLEYKKSLAARFTKLLPHDIANCADPIASLFGVAYTPTHADYHIGQLILTDGRIEAVVDFSAAATLPAVWELMRSYVQSFREEYFASDDINTDSDRIDVDRLCRYAGAYLEYFKLTARDLEAAPYIYLFQLLRSKYGYSNYLNGDESATGLLQFAFRRTNICRELERSAETISSALMRLV